MGTKCLSLCQQFQTGHSPSSALTCMFLSSWKISMVLKTMSCTVSCPMRHSEAVFTSRAACACCTGNWPSGGVVMRSEAGEALGQVATQCHTVACLQHRHTRELNVGYSSRVWNQDGPQIYHVPDQAWVKESEQIWKECIIEKKRLHDGSNDLKYT